MIEPAGIFWPRFLGLHKAVWLVWRSSWLWGGHFFVAGKAMQISLPLGWIKQLQGTRSQQYCGEMQCMPKLLISFLTLRNKEETRPQVIWENMTPGSGKTKPVKAEECSWGKLGIHNVKMTTSKMSQTKHFRPARCWMCKKKISLG